MKDFDAELLIRNLRDFRACFSVLTPTEQVEALQCILKSVLVSPGKMTLEVFELLGFVPGSQNRTEWLPNQDSNF